MQKIIGLIVIVLIIVLSVFFYTKNKNDNSMKNDSSEISYPSDSTDEEVFCTMDAMLCPDGSYVGRVGPDCEFEACPSTSGEEVDDTEEEIQDEFFFGEGK